MRSVLAEIGYMSNAEDMLKIADPVFQKAVAYGLAQQIRAYFERQ
jgi:N-acetylmuramoyl-L-alanine amidase